MRPENTHMLPAIESINDAQSATKIVILVGVYREIKHVISHCVEEETTGKRVLLAGEKMSSIPNGKRIEVKGYMKKEYWEPKSLSPFPSQWVEYLQVSEIKIIE